MEVNHREPTILWSSSAQSPPACQPFDKILYVPKLSPQSIEETLLASRPMPVVYLLLKTNSSQVRHKAMVQCSGASFCVAPPIYSCDSMSCRGQGACSPQGSLIQETGSFPQHTPSSLPTTFTFHRRDAVWNSNDTCSTSHPWGKRGSGSWLYLKCQFEPTFSWEDPDQNSYLMLPVLWKVRWC